MIDLRTPNRELWLWLFHDGGAWTAHDLARQIGKDDIERVFNQLSAMERRGLLVKLPPLPGCRRLRYAVTGTCLVPHGLHVGEVQLCDGIGPNSVPAYAHAAKAAARSLEAALA
jgi:hypothetical protein